MTDTLPPPSNAMEMVWRLVRSGSHFDIARVSDVEEAIRAYAAAAVQAERERASAIADRLDDLADHADAHTCSHLREIAAELRSKT